MINVMNKCRKCTSKVCQWIRRNTTCVTMHRLSLLLVVPSICFYLCICRICDPVQIFDDGHHDVRCMSKVMKMLRYVHKSWKVEREFVGRVVSQVHTYTLLRLPASGFAMFPTIPYTYIVLIHLCDRRDVVIQFFEDHPWKSDITSVLHPFGNFLVEFWHSDNFLHFF